jgi:thiosulfate/3-mercaptopyruvate sulfurtransferase
MAAPLSDVSKYDTLLDVSQGVTKFIPGAVHIDYLNFQNNSTLRPASELAKILSNAGISRNDSVLIYGECKCGLGPSVSTYVYWIMRYLGHDPQKVRVLDGGITDWGSNHPVANESLSRPKANYSSALRPEMLATYDEVKGGQFSIVDARLSQDWGNDSILGSLSIPFDQVMSNGRIKDETTLSRMFLLHGLRKNKPVVVYSNEGVQASLVWFSLEAMGYQAKLYTWKDWTEHKN